MHLDFLFQVFRESEHQEAVVFRGRSTSYRELVERCEHWGRWLDEQGIAAGQVVALKAEYSPDSIAMFLALAQRHAIVLQVGLAKEAKLEELLRTGEAEALIEFSGRGDVSLSRTGVQSAHDLYARLRSSGHPGLVLFSSGSTGAVKGTVHDLAHLLKKYHRRRHNLRTITFLLFDHIGGIDTLFYCLSNGSAMIVLEQRDPATVCLAVAQHRAEVLPVAPTFLNLLHFSKEYEKHDLRSLKYVTYGAEMMPAPTLKACARMFPHATLLQKYGTSEVGTLRSQSKSNDSLWMKLGGEGFQWRVVDGILQIHAESAMLGYLNAPSPFTSDGWFVTGDRVEVEGEYLRMLGRDSDLINVGGKKVYPAEVESVIKELPDVIEVSVYGEANALLGQIVAARIWAAPGVDEASMRKTIKQHAESKLDSFKVPMRINFSSEGGAGTDRFKKVRRELV